MIIFLIINLIFHCWGSTAGGETYEADIDEIPMGNKQAKRCRPEYFATDESSGCQSSEETTMGKGTVQPKTEMTTIKTIIIPKGSFFNFLVNICNSLLTKFKPYGIAKYFNVLNKSLRGLGYGHLMKMMLNRFCNKLKKLSNFNGNLLRVKVTKFLKILHEGNPILNEYFHAMNQIYKIKDDNEMDDYIYNLRQYGQSLTQHIGQRTRKVFQGLVFHILYKQKKNTKDDIALKFKLAVIEYQGKI